MSENAEFPKAGKKDREDKETNQSQSEIAGLYEAIHIVKKSGKGKKRPLDEDYIKAIHAKVLGYFPDEKPGRYRNTPVVIRDALFNPLEWRLIPRQMERFGTELAERATVLTKSLAGTESAIELAAWSHHEIVSMQPFLDGNNRTACLLVDTIFKRAGMYYITDWGSKGDEYLNVLKRLSESGNVAHLEKFLADKLIARYGELESKLMKSRISAMARRTNTYSEFVNRRVELERISADRAQKLEPYVKNVS